MSSIHEKPNYIEHFTASKEAKSEFDVEIVEVVEKINGKKGGYNNQLG